MHAARRAEVQYKGHVPPPAPRNPHRVLALVALLLPHQLSLRRLSSLCAQTLFLQSPGRHQPRSSTCTLLPPQPSLVPHQQSCSSRHGLLPAAFQTHCTELRHCLLPRIGPGSGSQYHATAWCRVQCVGVRPGTRLLCVSSGRVILEHAKHRAALHLKFQQQRECTMQPSRLASCIRTPRQACFSWVEPVLALPSA